MKRYRWLIHLLGPALLVLFLATSDLRQMAQILAGAQIGPVLLSLALMLVFLPVKAWRWTLILRQMDIQLALWPATMLYSIGIYLGAVTPGQAGDLVKAWYLRDHGHPLGAGLVSVVLDRLFDLLVMGLLAGLSVLAFYDRLPNPTAQALVAGLFVVGVVVALVVLLLRGPREWLFRHTLPLLPFRLRELLATLQAQVAGLHLRGGPLALIGLASLVSAFVTFYRVYLLFIAIDIRVPLLAFIAMTALTALVQVLPSIAGVGTRDALLIGLLALYDYPPEAALSLSALLLLLNVEHIVAGFLVSLRYPLGRQYAAEQQEST